MNNANTRISSLWERINKREQEILDYREYPSEEKRIKIQDDLNSTKKFFNQNSGKLSNESQDKFRNLFRALQNGLLLKNDFSEIRILKDDFRKGVEEMIDSPLSRDRLNKKIATVGKFFSNPWVITIGGGVAVLLIGFYILGIGQSDQTNQTMENSSHGVQIVGSNNNVNTASDLPIVFKYDYSTSDKLFFVSSNSDVQISKVEWVLASKWSDGQTPLENKVTDFVSIGDFPTKLSRGELEDILSMNAGINVLTELGKDLLQCILLQYAQDGIPVLTNITYSTPGSSSKVTVRNLALITRLDTPYPEIVLGLQNVTDNAIIFDYFNKNVYLLDFATKQVDEYKQNQKSEGYSGQLKTYTGECGFRLNQPTNGY